MWAVGAQFRLGMRKNLVVYGMWASICSLAQTLQLLGVGLSLDCQCLRFGPCLSPSTEHRASMWVRVHSVKEYTSPPRIFWPWDEWGAV